jgi:hypothetical protein
LARIKHEQAAKLGERAEPLGRKHTGLNAENSGHVGRKASRRRWGIGKRVTA